MEIEGQDGAKIELSNSRHDKMSFGRASGLSTADRSVSRRHVAFQVKPRANQTPPRVSFEVLGKNPVWVRRNEDDEVRVFRRSEKGELSEGDWFCVSAKEPAWFALRRIWDEDREARVSDVEFEIESELGPSSPVGSELEGFDASDPVKEFGFLVLGHEFDQYPKHMIHDMKRWNWFLEDKRKESSDEEEPERKEKKRNWGKRKKGKKGDEENEDEDWTGESEDDDTTIGTARKASRPSYSTRSKDRGKQPDKDARGRGKSVQKKVYNADEDDEEDETLGGFIMGDEDEELEEEEINGDDDEEEEFLEEDEDDDE